MLPLLRISENSWRETLWMGASEAWSPMEEDRTAKNQSVSLQDKSQDKVRKTIENTYRDGHQILATSSNHETIKAVVGNISIIWVLERHLFEIGSRRHHGFNRIVVVARVTSKVSSLVSNFSRKTRFKKASSQLSILVTVRDTTLGQRLRNLIMSCAFSLIVTVRSSPASKS
jgi:hypothetical protein